MGTKGKNPPPIPVGERIVHLLEKSGRTDAELVVGYTYHALAAEVYGTDEPTDAQLAAVHGATARLVKEGRAYIQPVGSIATGRPWLKTSRAVHERETENRALTAHGLDGVGIFRMPSAEDDAARDKWWKNKRKGESAAATASLIARSGTDDRG